VGYLLAGMTGHLKMKFLCLGHIAPLQLTSFYLCPRSTVWYLKVIIDG